MRLSRLLRPLPLLALAAAALGAWWLFVPAREGCEGVLGSGRFDGREVLAFGVCGTAFHAYEESIEVFPRRWIWVPAGPASDRIAVIDPTDLGGVRDPKTQSLRFRAPPAAVRFGAGRSVTIEFADGTRQAIELPP